GRRQPTADAALELDAASGWYRLGQFGPAREQLVDRVDDAPVRPQAGAGHPSSSDEVAVRGRFVVELVDRLVRRGTGGVDHGDGHPAASCQRADDELDQCGPGGAVARARTRAPT